MAACLILHVTGRWSGGEVHHENVEVSEFWRFIRCFSAAGGFVSIVLRGVFISIVSNPGLVGVTIKIKWSRNWWITFCAIGLDNFVSYYIVSNDERGWVSFRGSSEPFSYR